MKLCLITTTIYEPSVLALYRQFGPDVPFIIAGDKKTPHESVRALCKRIGNARYLDPDEQERLGYKSSAITGWNTVRRRNIALLEAIKLKPDVIVTIDDDNLPLRPDYFEQFKSRFAVPFSGLCVETDKNWFDVGRLIEPAAAHRGFPHPLRHADLGQRIKPVTDKRIGVVAGLWLGDPDTDALTRIVNAPQVHQMSETLRAGLAVVPGCFSPFNSQNTAYTLALAPLMMMLPGTARYDDIWASYIAERVMLSRDEHVLYGEPFVWQERNAHNLINDMKDEILGLEHTTRFVNDMLALDIGRDEPVAQLRRIYEGLNSKDYIPQITKDAGAAWCDDVEKVLR